MALGSARNPVLVFLHDDVKLRFSREEWDKFLRRSGQSWQRGIGGGRFPESRVDRTEVCGLRLGFGSGGCLHESENSVWYTTFRPIRNTLTVDGIFLSHDKDKYSMNWMALIRVTPVGDWYDTDITFRSHLLCYRNFTYPLPIQHGTTNYRKDGYCLDQKEFFKHVEYLLQQTQRHAAQLVECR